jgi:hypothetical protein
VTYHKNTIIVLYAIFLSAAFATSGILFQTVFAQVNGTVTGLSAPTQAQGFSSAFNTFVTSASGYGVYEEKDTNNFQPGEEIVLYIEPVGFEYGTVGGDSSNDDESDDSQQLHTINFSADFIISDTDGNVLTGQQGIPVSEIISHHENKEVFIPFTITQTSPFPEGDYVITFTIHDDNSGKSFNITKDITVSNDS